MALKQKLSMPIHVLTGRMGSGKSTRASTEKGYDLKVGTDTGKPDGKGGYTVLSKVDRDKVRNDKLAKILKADARGKRVLVEGHPTGVEKLFGPHVNRINQVTELDIRPSVAMSRVKSRAIKRGTNPAVDARAAKIYNRFYGKSLKAISAGAKKVVKIKVGSIRAFRDELIKISGMQMMPFYQGMGLANKVENVGLQRKGKPTISEKHIGHPLHKAVRWATGE